MSIVSVNFLDQKGKLLNFYSRSGENVQIDVQKELEFATRLMGFSIPDTTEKTKMLSGKHEGSKKLEVTLNKEGTRLMNELGEYFYSCYGF